MELRQLITFREVAQTLSFSQAASKLSYAQSTVSAQIQTLETQLGVALFDRLGKQVVLTEAGHHLLSYTDKILSLINEAESFVSNGQENQQTMMGALTIKAPGTLCTYRLPAVLRLYRTRYPQVQLTLPPESDVGLQQSLREGKVDLALVMEQPFQAPQLVVEPLIREPMLIVTYPDHPLAKQQHVTFADLPGQPMILTEATCGYRKLFEKALSTAGVRLSNPMEFYSVEAIKQCVMAGIGLTFLPLVAVQHEIQTGQLVSLHWAGPELSVVTQMIWHKDKWLSPALRAFIAVTKEIFQQYRYT